MRVLIVEDDPASLDLAKRIVENMGHSVFAAVDGVEGLALARDVRPDLLLVDMHLPGLDGWLVVRELRRSDAALRIICLSAGDRGEGERAIAAGCNEFIAKPYDPDTLRAAINR